MASSDSQINKLRRGHPKRAELLDVNINTGAQKKCVCVQNYATKYKGNGLCLHRIPSNYTIYILIDIDVQIYITSTSKTCLKVTLGLQKEISLVRCIRRTNNYNQKSLKSLKDHCLQMLKFIARPYLFFPNTTLLLLPCKASEVSFANINLKPLSKQTTSLRPQENIMRTF